MNKKIIYKSKVLCKAYVANTFIKRLSGYMFQNEPYYNALIIAPCSSIHTFFMRFNLDVLFIDKNLRVIIKVNSLRPGKIIMPVKDSLFVIESREGILKNIKVNDRINIA